MHLRGRNALVAGLLGLTLAATPLAPALAGTNSIIDNDDYDVSTRDIDIHKLSVRYNAKGVRGTLKMKDLRPKKRLRIFVAFLTRPNGEPEAPEYGNFVEFRLDLRGKRRVVNWQVDPSFGDYRKVKCRGVKVKVDYAKDTLTYKVPNRCAKFDRARGYVDSYGSARKYRAKHWDKGSPADSTGDWFDTTYDLITRR